MSNGKKKSKNAVATKRPYSQDFSGVGKTDKSFAPSCDVNNIVRHYEQTGIDPYIDRQKLARFDAVPPLTYEEAMFKVAEVKSAFALLPSQERAKHANDPTRWLEHLQAENGPQNDSESPITPLEDPAPQDSSEVKSEEKVQ